MQSSVPSDTFVQIENKYPFLWARIAQSKMHLSQPNTSTPKAFGIRKILPSQRTCPSFVFVCQSLEFELVL